MKAAIGRAAVHRLVRSVSSTYICHWYYYDVINNFLEFICSPYMVIAMFVFSDGICFWQFTIDATPTSYISHTYVISTEPRGVKVWNLKQLHLSRIYFSRLFPPWRNMLIIYLQMMTSFMLTEINCYATIPEISRASVTAVIVKLKLYIIWASVKFWLLT